MLNEKDMEKLREKFAGVSDLALVSLLQERIKFSTEKILEEVESFEEIPMQDMNNKVEEVSQLQLIRDKKIPTVSGEVTANKVAIGYDIICRACGGEATVPFKPNPDWPSYCRPCYDKKKNGEL